MAAAGTAMTRREGTLVAEVQVVGYLAHGHVGLGKHIADFLVEQRGDVVIDGRAAYLLDQPGEIRGRQIEFVGIETYLAFLAEVAIKMVEEHFVDRLLMP